MKLRITFTYSCSIKHKKKQRNIKSLCSYAGAFDEGLLFLQLRQAILTETEKTKLEFVEILIGHIVVLDLPGGFHDSFH